MKSKALAIGSVLIMCMTVFTGMCLTTDGSDAASTYGSSSNPLSYINYTLDFDGADAGSTWYVRTGSYVTFHNFEDGGGLDEFGSIVRSATQGYGLDNSGCGRVLKPGKITLSCRWWNGANGGDFTLTVIAVGNEFFPHTLHYEANGGSGSVSDYVYYSDASGTCNVTAGNGSGFTKSGYYIQSWNTAANGTGTSYAVGAGVPVPKNGTVTLYAQWAVDDRNGTASDPLTSLDTYPTDSVTYYLEVGSQVTLRGWDDVPEGLTWVSGQGLGLTSYFIGSSDFDYDVYGLSGTLNSTGTLTTHWNFYLEDGVEDSYTVTIVSVQTNVTHTITYAGNGNTGGSMSDTVVTDKTNGNISVSLAACGFTKTGYSFSGWKVGNTVYQPGQSVTVGANATVTATAQWTQNTLTASANTLSCLSGMAYTNQISASASNGASLSYAVKSCTGGNASVNSSGLVTYSAPTVSSTTTYTVTVTVTATFPTGDVLTRDVSFSANVDPVLSFTNAATSGTLSVKGA